MKPIEFLGDSRDVLKSFPRTARRTAGQQLEFLQTGRDPGDWKPMGTGGPGVRGIRDEDGAFRILYVRKFVEAIVVLHCFQKKTQKTSKMDLELAARRYRMYQRVRG